ELGKNSKNTRGRNSLDSFMSLQIESPLARHQKFGRVAGSRKHMTVMAVFGTRPEAIKLAPVITALNRRHRFRVVTVFTGQHPDLARPAQELFGIRHDYDLAVMVPDQPLSTMCGRLLSNLDPLLLHERPDLVLVQGDTTSAMAGALSAFHRHIAVGHV